MNRDTAILYINGIFLESATHAVCLKKYINNNKLNIKSFNLQKRPDHEIFIELSINIGPIVIGHKVDKEKLKLMKNKFDGLEIESLIMADKELEEKIFSQSKRGECTPLLLIFHNR